MLQNSAQQSFRAGEIYAQNANAPANLGLGSGYVPSGNSYQSGDLGWGSFGIDIPISDQVRAMAAEAEGGRMLMQMRDASIDAELTAELAQARQARMTRAAATTAASAGTSQEEAGAIYMAYGGRAARNAGSSAVGTSISEAPGMLSNLGNIGRAYLNDQIGFGDAVSMANDQIGGYGNVARDTLTGLANGGIRTFGTAISLIGPSPGELPFPEFGYTGRTGELGPDIAMVTSLGLGARGVRNAAAAEATAAEIAGANGGIGKLVGNFSAIEPGPLADNLAGTFAGGRYTTVTLQNDTILYRAGTADQPLGQFFSQEPSTSALQTRIDKAVLPVWPGGGTSPIDTSFAVKIPAGTQVHIGEVGTQSGFYIGGTQQVVVPKPWTIPGVQVINASPLK